LGRHTSYPEPKDGSARAINAAEAAAMCTNGPWNKNHYEVNAALYFRRL